MTPIISFSAPQIRTLARSAALFFALALSVSNPSQAQFELPGTDIWLITLAADQVDPQTPPRQLTSRPGYENQPAFSADGRQLYYTRGEDNGYTDIAALDLNSGHSRILVTTGLSEFSALEQPSGQITMVQVQNDGAQWLVSYNPTNRQFTRLNQSPGVGYYRWREDRGAIQFTIGDPARLEYWPHNANQGQLIASDVGRSLHLAADGTLFYTQSEPPNSVLHIIASDALKHHALTVLPEARQDFAISPQGDVWVGIGARLYRWQNKHPRWQLMTDLSTAGITNISRLAFNHRGTHLALVDAE